MSSSFNIDVSGFRATITFNRPERHNSLEISDLEALGGMLADLATRDDVRVLVLSGGTSRSFCSGVDLGNVAEHDWSDNPLERLTDRLENLPFATIAALQGGVYGGGTDIALACDFRIGVRGMKAFIPPAKLGIQYHPRGLRRAVSRLGIGPAKRFFIGGETMTDEELLRIGFIDHLVAPEALNARVEEMVATISGLAPLSVRGMKETLNSIARNELDEPRARKLAANSFNTEDFQEGRRALAEKRPPQFKGR